MAVEAMSNSSGEASLREFVVAHVSTEYQESIGGQALQATLQLSRDRCGNAGGIGVSQLPECFYALNFESAAGRWDLEILLGDALDHRIEKLSLERRAEPDTIPAFGSAT